MTAFAAAMDALFADPNIGRDAVYIADGGVPALVRAVARRGDAISDFGDARLWSETTRIDLRVAEVPSPRPGDRIEIDGEAFLIQGEPVRDRERLVWTLDLRPTGTASAPHMIESGDGTLIVRSGVTLASESVIGGDEMLEIAA